MVIYEKIDRNDSSLLTMTNEAGTLTAEDNHTVLLILDLSDSLDVSDDSYSEDSSSDDEYYEWRKTCGQ